MTLLFVSHDTTLVKSFCERAIYLARGRLKAEGRPEVITELYALDIRQAEGAHAGNPVALKPFIGEGPGIAFGTGEGRIARAAFCGTGTTRATSKYGDDLVFDVDVEFADDVAQPSLSVIVHDRQARELGGAFFPIDKAASANGVCRTALRCGIHQRLGAGPWSITLRLENRRSGQLAFPIDKQVGALIFEVEQPDRGAYVALVDLKLTCEQAST